MNITELFLKCCQAHEWDPVHIHRDGSGELDSTHIDEEAKEALRQGKVKLCLNLIELAKTTNLKTTTQLELKASAISQLILKSTKENSKNTSKIRPLGELVKKLQEKCKEQNWASQFLQSADSSDDQWVVEQAILKEAETARNAGRADLSLEMINITLEIGFNSLWLHHLKAKALHKTGIHEEAIEIWEKLSTHEIEGFSEKVRSDLEIARTEQILSHARQQEKAGNLDTAIGIIASELLNNPNQNNLETGLKQILRKRRNKHSNSKENELLEAQCDEIELNQAFLIQAEARLSSHNSTKTDN